MPSRTAILLAATAFASTATAQDFANAPVVPGSWGYRSAPSSSQAQFTDARAVGRIALGCTRAERRVNISIAYPAAVPVVSVWTSSTLRSVPVRFDPATRQLVADFAAYDSLLDAIAFSRGRFAVTVPGAPPLIVPSWPEVARVIEDCRS